MNIFMIGFMGCGKSTVGKKLAKELRLQFIDLDKYIINKHQKAISDIFDTEGESGFRMKESEALREVCTKTDLVVSTGGGTPCYEDNMKFINENGISIYIEMNPAALLNRLKNSKAERPLINNMNDEELSGFIAEKLEERLEYYNSANIKVDGINLNANILFKEIDKFLSKKD